MKHKKCRKMLDIEFVGGIAGLLLIICAVISFLDMENAQGFFAIATGLGTLMNGILSWLKFEKRRYVSGIGMMMVTVTLLVLFLIQIMSMEGFW